MIFKFHYTLYERDELGMRSKTPIPGWNSSRWDYGMIQAIENASGRTLKDGTLREITPDYWEFDFERPGIAIGHPRLTLIIERDTENEPPQKGVAALARPRFK